MIGGPGAPDEARPALPGTPVPLTPYQRRLVAFLGVASFFEGYDFMALSQLLPTIRATMGVSVAGAGRLFAFVNFGTILAWFLVRHADRLGRRRLLFLTITGYTIFTAASALSHTVYEFACFQLLGRVFLIAEWSVAMVTAAEEFPAARRGTLIGIIQALSALGSIVCAGVVPLMLHAPLGWRSVYLVSIVPLVVMAVARRGLKESARFAAMAQQGSAVDQGGDLLAIFRTPYRRRVLQLALIWGVGYICTNNAVAFWKDFALHERGLTEPQAGLALSIAAVVSTPLLFLVGRLLDDIGRRRGALLILPLISAGVAAAYGLHGMRPLTGALVLAILGVGAFLPLMNAFTSELFPTEMRGTAFAWTNNLLGRLSYVISPIVIGEIAERVGYGPTMTVTAAAPLLCLVLVLLWLPETAGRELEETARS